MIKSITKKQIENKLEVTVETNLRRFLKSPVELLTDQEIFEIVKEEFEVIKTLQTPNHPVGNSCRRGVKQTGLWVYEIKVDKIESQISEPELEAPIVSKTEIKELEPQESLQPKAASNRKRRPSSKKTSTKPSIRGRMTKIAKKEE
mgnify:CR=1 FL=1